MSAGAASTAIRADAAALAGLRARLEALALKLGLEFDPVAFELVPNNFMAEIAVYGLPVRMRHWSFGVRYIHHLASQHMGHSKIFEVMFPGDPCHAFMLEENSLAENVLVTAHVLGHADFAKRNALFVRALAMAGGHILEQSAARAHRLARACDEHGQERVEAVLDAALALEGHIDINLPLDRPRYPTAAAPATPAEPGTFDLRFGSLPGAAVVATPPPGPVPALPVPPAPERDLLWFIAHYAPELEPWERDVFLAVREEAFYFYPIHACQIMNEGWASYWHARLLREADFLPHALYLSAVKSHSDVVRPFAGSDQLSLSLNPYHLGFAMWERLIAERGIDVARAVCRDEDDFGFVRNYLDAALARELDLFVYEARKDGDVKVATRDIHALREAILAPKFNFGAPSVSVTQLGADGSLELRHDYLHDGRGLDLGQAERVMGYVAKVWRRPVSLHTVDFRGVVRVLPTKKAAP